MSQELKLGGISQSCLDAIEYMGARDELIRKRLFGTDPNPMRHGIFYPGQSEPPPIRDFVTSVDMSNVRPYTWTDLVWNAMKTTSFLSNV